MNQFHQLLTLGSNFKRSKRNENQFRLIENP